MMEAETDASTVLDYAVFHVSCAQNRYEAIVCSEGITEKLVSGPLDQLALHLPQANECHSKTSINRFKLQVNGSHEGSAWFTKSTLARFLNMVNEPGVLTNSKSIENEMSQLEEMRSVHLSLYAKDHPERTGNSIADNGSLNLVAVPHKINIESPSSDGTKNELLRAMDIRLMALRDEFAVSFSRPLGATCSARQISDLATFAQYFGALDLRNSLLKYLALLPRNQPADPSIKQAMSGGSKDTSENMKEAFPQPPSQSDNAKPFVNTVSSAKVAQAERQSSTGSDESSDSGDEDRSFADRSRPVIRSASPRRSASPMRRIQIGRSGSRRSPALTIKSLSYFPARERGSNATDVEGNEGGGEESEEPAKKPDNSGRRMSVQDAISLFERKQKDQCPDQKKTASEVSVYTNKSVLRRWSAGMGDSFTQCSQENCSDSGNQTSNNQVPEAEEISTDVKESDDPSGCPDASAESFEGAEKMTSHPVDDAASKSEEVNDRAAATAEWTRQKEAELNQMLMKMMENKPAKYETANALSGSYEDITSEHRGGFYSEYKEKRDEKLRAENVGKQSQKDAHFKVMQETLGQSKARMASKGGAIKGKQDSSSNPQKPRRNSSPPVLSKKEVSKPTTLRKPSSKASSPLPATRSSWSSGSLPKTGTPPAKTPAAGTMPNRRKPQPTPSPSRPSPRPERQPQQPKSKKGISADSLTVKVREEKQQKASPKSSKSVKTKTPPGSGEDSGLTSAKPSFYNKVTKKGSVVPVESKPFLRKGTGMGRGVGSVAAKPKASQADEYIKSNGNLVDAELKESASMAAESDSKEEEDSSVQPTNKIDADSEVHQDQETSQDHAENSNQYASDVHDSFKDSLELPVSEILPAMEMGISAAAWVEGEHHEVPASCENGQLGSAMSPEFAPVASSSPRIRHSLSQMLQADSCEPEIIEWGNAENPPSLVYQKDAPKGFKRLLKFARKSKGEANATGWASPSVFSEGEDDPEEVKAASKRNSDALLRKVGLQAKGHGQRKPMLTESYDGGDASNRSMDYRGVHDGLSAQSSMLRTGQTLATSTSSKATRSFFSLSTFRSSKSGEAKLR